jgi:hypothetical protein
MEYQRGILMQTTGARNYGLWDTPSTYTYRVCELSVKPELALLIMVMMS